MREIKFRCWDTINERMVDDFLLFEKLTFKDIEDDSRYDVPYRYYEDHRDWEDGIWRPCQVMQYTGRNDKNGKEIYEGDVIKSDRFKFYVVFLNGSFRVKSLGRLVSTNHLLARLDRPEVIGNIYQNPELLATKTNNP